MILPATCLTWGSPKVISAKDVQPPSDFRMYDAVPADKKPASPAFDSNMEKFLPMLQNYLRSKLPFS
jgi:hypothetical protein